jgi:hypothetical protein
MAVAPKTDPAPVITPPATPVTGCEAVRQEASKYPDWDINLITAIAKAESGCRHNATGDGHLTYQANGRTYGYSVSVLQVRILPGREACDSHDIKINVQCAHKIWKGQGYAAWSVYNSGKYRQFL